MKKKFKIINTAYIEMISDNPEFKKKLFDLFKQNVFEFKKLMTGAINDKNYNQLKELAHKAKSTVEILGMNQEAENMKSLELDLKKKKNQDSYKQRVSEFLISCSKALEEIRLAESKTTD